MKKNFVKKFRNLFLKFFDKIFLRLLVLSSAEG